MIVLSYAMTKSGSTLALELCKALLEQRGYPQRRLPDGIVQPGPRINFAHKFAPQIVSRMLEEVGEDEIIAIKTHNGLTKGQARFIEERVAAGQIKVHVNHRDLREICLSLMDAGENARSKGKPAFAEIHTLADAADAIRTQIMRSKYWCSIKGALHLHYNDVAFNTRVAADQMCNDFNFEPVTDEEFDVICKKIFGGAFTQKNKARIDRYKELSQSDEKLLHDKIPDLQGHIRGVCLDRDYSWFASASDETAPAQ